MVPKASDPAVLSAFSEKLDHELAIVALVESLTGLDNLDVLAQIANVKRFAFGHLDFQLDMGMQCLLDEIELTPARFMLVAASRRANLAAPIDGVTVDTRDEARLVADVRRSMGFGFSGKLCIHPNQVEQVNAALAPSLDDISWAQRVVLQAKISGGEVFNLDGQMVDLPVILKAQKTLARAQQFGLTE
jgi:citrate lyase subunit beta/citryl-CoA lyase